MPIEIMRRLKKLTERYIKIKNNAKTKNDYLNVKNELHSIVEEINRIINEYV